MLGRGRRVISLAGFGAVVDKLPFKTTMSFGLSCGMMGGLFYAGMSTSHHFSAIFRPLFCRRSFALSGFPATRRRERAKSGVKPAKFGGETAEK